MIFDEIQEERERQDKLWGEQNHHPSVWTNILMEEVGEVAKEASQLWFEPNGACRSAAKMHYVKELIQVAAVAVAMIESFNRNKWGDL